MRMATTFVLLVALMNLTSTAAGIPQQDGYISANDIQYRLSRIGDTKLQFPRLTSYKDEAILNRVNAQIDEFSKQFGCPPPSGKYEFYKLSSRVEYAAQDIFSIYASAGYYCGGPYPTNDENLSLTFDLRTGEKVDFRDLFENYEVNKGAILKIIFAQQLAKTKTLRAAGSKTDDQNSDCDSDPLYTPQTLGRTDFAYNFSPKGLVVQPDWPHVIEACALRVTVPYRQLEKFAAPHSILTRAISNPE